MKTIKAHKTAIARKHRILRDIYYYYAELEYEDDAKFEFEELWDSRIADLIVLRNILEGQVDALYENANK